MFKAFKKQGLSFSAMNICCFSLLNIVNWTFVGFHQGKQFEDITFGEKVRKIFQYFLKVTDQEITDFIFKYFTDLFSIIISCSSKRNIYNMVSLKEIVLFFEEINHSTSIYNLRYFLKGYVQNHLYGLLNLCSPKQIYQTDSVCVC